MNQPMDSGWRVTLSSRAIAQGWDITVEQRTEIIDFLTKVALGKYPNMRLRARLKACDTLLKLPQIQLGAAQLRIAERQLVLKERGPKNPDDIINEAEARARRYDAENPPSNGKDR